MNDKYIHELTVDGYCLRPQRISAGTSGSYGLERLKLTFSEEWEGLGKAITFYPPRSQPVTVALVENEIDIPPEATARSGQIPFSVQGSSNGKRIYSFDGFLDVMVARAALGDASQGGTPTEIEQIRALVQQIYGVSKRGICQEP